MKHKQIDPPKIAKQFLFWFLKDELAEEVEGDLNEMFSYMLETTNPGKARRNYWFQVLNYIRPFALRHIHPQASIYFMMQRNYIKIALRVFFQNKITYLINSIGLGIALACCITAYLFFAYDVEFDSFHDMDKMSRVFKVHTHSLTKTGNQLEGIEAPLALAPAARMQIAGIELYCRYMLGGWKIFTNEKSFEEEIAFADSTFFDMFEFPLIKGSHDGFRDRNAVYLSAVCAEKVFGEKDPIGKTLGILFPNDTSMLLTVGGVLDKVPENNSFVFDVLVPIEQYEAVHGTVPGDWETEKQASTFFTLTHEGSASQVDEQLAQYVSIRNQANKDIEVQAYKLQPFHTALGQFSHENIDSGSVHLRLGFLPLIIFGFLALMILLIACFNLTNTTIALTTKRMKEIGVRKSLGAKRYQIFWQFLTETFITMTVALILGWLFAKVLVAEFRAMSNFKYGLEELDGLNFVIAIVVLVFLGALIAGTYPALRNSKLAPTTLLKGRIQVKGTNWLNRSLIGAQFALTVIFLISGMVFYQNNLFQQGLDYHYAKDEVIAVSLQDNSQYIQLKHRVASLPGLIGQGGTANHIGYTNLEAVVEIGEDAYDVRYMAIGENYLETMGFSLSDGRLLQAQSDHDRAHSIVVNQAFLEKTGLQEALGQEIFFQHTKKVIVGVVGNHIEDVERPNEAFVFHLSDPSAYRTMVLRTHPAHKKQTYAAVENLWREQFPHDPFEAQFQDELIYADFKQVNSVFGKVFIFLTLLGCALSISGIFSLTTLNIAKRLKEIGVRKVLGATTTQLIGLINREFLWVLGISTLLGAVGGAFASDTLLATIYSFHVPVGWAPIILGVFGIFIAGTFTTSMTVLRAALANPVHVLKRE